MQKCHTTSVAAFTSPHGRTTSGLVAKGHVGVMLAPGPARLNIPAPAAAGDVRTALVTMVLGDDGELLRAAAGRFEGLVVAGFGAGHAQAALAAVWARSPRGFRWCWRPGPAPGCCWRTPTPPRAPNVTCASARPDRGRVLDPLKARILLHVLLAAGAGRAEIAAAFRFVGADPGGPADAVQPAVPRPPLPRLSARQPLPRLGAVPPARPRAWRGPSRASNANDAAAAFAPGAPPAPRRPRRGELSLPRVESFSDSVFAFAMSGRPAAGRQVSSFSRTGPTATAAVGSPPPRSVAWISAMPPGNVNGPWVTHWPWWVAWSMVKSARSGRSRWSRRR